MNYPHLAESGRSVATLMDHLAVADPQAADKMRGHLSGVTLPVDIRRLKALTETVISALAQELSFGRMLADGLGRMLAGGGAAELARYLAWVEKAATRGPTLAALFARHLVPVLLCGDEGLVKSFEDATHIMLGKGTYTLKAPLEALSTLIGQNDLASAHAFIDLLSVTYQLDITYNRCVYLTHTLPRAVTGFSVRRRLWQIRGLTRVIEEDEHLADDYLQGLAAGLHLLKETALDAFLDRAFERYEKDSEAGGRFLSLDSRQAKSLCRDLQVAVPLGEVRAALERYLNARTGLAVAVRPLGAVGTQLVRCDGRIIYLPGETDLLEKKKANVDLLKLLVRLEAGAIEFGTFDLDVEKALGDDNTTSPTADVDSDLKKLVSRFENFQAALDLFTLFEQARIARHVRQRYPGLSRRIEAALADAGLHRKTGGVAGGTLLPVYQDLVCGEALRARHARPAVFRTMIDGFEREMAAGNDAVETSARLTREYYEPLMEGFGCGGTDAYEPLRLPFGHCFEPDFFGPFHTAYHRLATDLHRQLKTRHIRVLRSDIHRLLVRQSGQISADDLTVLVVSHNPSANGNGAADPAALDLAALLGDHALATNAEDEDTANAFRYREWDASMGDYIPDRARVLEHEIKPGNSGFYEGTLERFHGLVRRIRYAFELLRPEELTILRQWRDGDAFDYRALLDYAVDKKAGLMPSDRLFIKRTKKIRDVAALLLVDLSRSTANAVDDLGTRVLDVEKQAIVLLCEALRVVGDRFAIAGFSGTGPLGVDYYRIKDLDETFDASIMGRIGAMAPQRSTRMGAAIRHATARLADLQARVRLILILGDGFPNDLEYKGAYAVEDTRRAVMEARAAGIHVKAITVNISDNGQLDRLYGQTHHTLIGNVQDLPDKLVRVYSALTKH